MKRYGKILISLAFAVSLCLAVGSSPAFAAGPNRSLGAYIASALMALNIGLEQPQQQINSVLNYLSDPFGVVWTNADRDIADYFDKSEIYIREDYVEIDGVPYSDVWISNNAAQKFRVDAGDIITAFNMVSNSNGTYASGGGYYSGVPMYKVGSYYRSQGFSASVPSSSLIGENISSFIFTDSGSSHPYNQYITLSDGNSYGPGGSFVSGDIVTSYFRSSSRTLSDSGISLESFNQSNRSGRINLWNKGLTVNSPFEFDWVSGTIPAETISPDDGLLIRVPSSSVQTIIDDYPEITTVSTDSEGNNYYGCTIDIDNNVNADLPDVVAGILPLILPFLTDGVATDPNVTVDFAPVPTDDTPIPPVSDDTISNTLYTDLQQDLQRIINTINNLGDTLVNAFSTIPAILGSIGDQITSLPQKLEEHFLDTYNKGINVLKNLLLPFFARLKSFLGIWHYVVEWLQSISAPFALFLRIFSGMSSIAMLPIYACIAGTIVIAVYKRFGR